MTYFDFNSASEQTSFDLIPKGTLVRLCLASAYAAYKTTADSTGPWKDSVIAITRDVINLDKVSRIAYQLQYDAYKSKHDTSNAMQSLGVKHVADRKVGPKVPEELTVQEAPSQSTA